MTITPIIPTPAVTIRLHFFPHKTLIFIFLEDFSSNNSGFSTPGIGGRGGNDYSNSSSSYIDSRPGNSRAQTQTQPPVQHTSSFLESNSKYSDDESDEDEIPESFSIAAEKARPRAPSGGSQGLQAPTQKAAPVDLLGLNSITAPSNPQQQQQQSFFSPPAAAQPSNNFAWGEFTSAPAAPSQFNPQSAGNQFQNTSAQFPVVQQNTPFLQSPQFNPASAPQQVNNSASIPNSRMALNQKQSIVQPDTKQSVADPTVRFSFLSPSSFLLSPSYLFPLLLLQTFSASLLSFL